MSSNEIPLLHYFLDRPQNRPQCIRILLPETAPKPGEYEWTWQRENELAQFDPAFGSGLLHKQIEANVQFLEKHVATNSIELRRFNSPHIGRIVVTDRFVYYTPYRSYTHARDCKIYKFRRGGEMYENLLRLFEQLWLAGAGSTFNTKSKINTIAEDQPIK